ncbi:terpene synthase family protein [Nocardia suismassiliense]|uniref:Terpene synthase n=1 Tax=Nocardia suismassiliense TaxID=2077092 RepID=A0ABW6R5L2_9NOCA
MPTAEDRFPLPRYPWPCTPHPDTEAFAQFEVDWLDEAFTFLPEGSIPTYQAGFYSLSASHIRPYGSFDRVKPSVRYMVYGTILDDYYEFADRDETEKAADRLFYLFLGAAPIAQDNGLLRICARAAQELTALMPLDFMVRHAASMRDYVRCGPGRESVYRRARVFPSVEECIAIRKLSIGVQPVLELGEVVMKRPLTPELVRHPLITRMGSLIAAMAAYQNDLFTWPREITLIEQGEVMNTVLCVRHQWGLTLEQAHHYILERNQQAIEEFEYLKNNLPDFGADTELVREYITLISYIPNGWTAWYAQTKRYQSGGHPDVDWLVTDSESPSLDTSDSGGG